MQLRDRPELRLDGTRIEDGVQYLQLVGSIAQLAVAQQVAGRRTQRGAHGELALPGVLERAVERALGDRRARLLREMQHMVQYSRVRPAIGERQDLPSIVLQQIEHFFTHYKDLEANKWVKVKRWGDTEEALVPERILELSGRLSAAAATSIAEIARINREAFAGAAARARCSTRG